MQNQITADVCVTESTVCDALDKLRGAVMIVYPMNLPPYDVIRQEFEGTEDLAGTQVSLSVFVTLLLELLIGRTTGIGGEQCTIVVGRERTC